ncbi:6357_t:CDS:1, partial [Cetraspora pellucida]
STCIEFSDEKIEHREDQDIISKTPKEQDTNTKEQVKKTNTYLTSTEYSQKLLNQPTIKDHDGMSLMLDQKMFIDLDNPLMENKDINIILKLNKNQIIKNCLNPKSLILIFLKTIISVTLKSVLGCIQPLRTQELINPYTGLQFPNVFDKTSDLDITSKESEQRSQIHSKVLVCNSSDEQDISKKQIKCKPESKRFHDHSKDLKDLEMSKPQKDHKRRLNALRKSSNDYKS